MSELRYVMVELLSRSQREIVVKPLAFRRARGVAATRRAHRDPVLDAHDPHTHGTCVNVLACAPTTQRRAGSELQLAREGTRVCGALA